MSAIEFSADDLSDLAARGIEADDARRQLERFARGPRWVELLRPCAVGDGIERLSTERFDGLHRLHAEAAAAGRLSKFVPASGAASRMFRELLHFHRGPGRDRAWDEIARDAGPEAAALVRFLDELPRLPFHDDLRCALRERGHELEALVRRRDLAPLLEALLDPAALGYASVPKGLLEFHRAGETSRTAFEEHLVEAADYVRDAARRCRVHFTVSPEHRAAFEACAARVAPRHAQALDAEFDLGFSVQAPSTDTLAAGADDRPLRDARGRLVFRPGGHGALIGNLAALDADLVFVKNIDNVQPDRLKPLASRWKRALCGRLIELQHDIHGALARLATGRHAASFDEAETIVRRLCADLDGRPPRGTPARRDALAAHLDRPIRVCGVVPNTGEPGGGPFWVRGPDGAAGVQIVESAQVDPHDAEQQRIFRSATHFNPVDLVCAVRDAEGRRYNLRRFVDEDAVILTRKSQGGRDVKAQERPGLWNGAMAGWTTLFVEVPLETFSPVKSVLDLLRAEHQG